MRQQCWNSSIKHQQNIPALKIFVVTLRAESNDIEALLPLMPTVRDVSLEAEPGRVVEIGE
jgi:hypothetical protein